MWIENDDGTIFDAPLPNCCQGEKLHREIDALKLGLPYRIEWLGQTIRIFFEGWISSLSRGAIEKVLDRHDATHELETHAAEQARKAAIEDESALLIEQARAKRMAGEPLDASELAAVVDRLLFGIR